MSPHPMTSNIRTLYLETSTEGTIGGSHHSLYQLVKKAKEAGTTPVVAFYEDNSLKQQFKELGCSVFVRTPPRRFNFIRFKKPSALVRYINSAIFFLYLSIFRAIQNAIWLKKNRIQLVHLNNNPFSMDWYFASRLVSIPCIAHQRGVRKRLDKSEIFLANSMDRVICISRYVWNSLERSGCNAHNFELIHNGIDTDDFKPRPKSASLKKKLSIPEGHYVLGLVGNIKEWKGQHVLVESLGEMVRTNNNITALFVGQFDKCSDEYRQKLQERIDFLGLSNNVVFTGYTPLIKEHLAVMDIVVHASIEPEPFGRVIIEAMAMEKPVVVSKDGGTEEIVEHEESGLLFEPGNSKMLSKYLFGLINDDEKMTYLSKNARERVIEKFDINDNVKKTVDVYRNAIGTNT